MMNTLLNPYLSFRNEAREAIAFYQSVFGGDVTINTFGDFQAAENPDDADKVMHAQLDAPGGLTLMASDTPSFMEFSGGSAISIALSGDDEATLRSYWEKLSDGGIVTMPLGPAPWAIGFGMCKDRFGIDWMVSITGTEA